MTLRERILAVYRGETPDVVPFMLDLSHWFYHKHRQPWDLSQAYETPELELINYHKQAGAGFYMPNLGAFYEARDADDVRTTVTKRVGRREITWRHETPLGAIERTRRWEEQTYAWGIPAWGLKTEQDLRVLAYALGGRTFSPRWDRWQAWADHVGDAGVVYLPAGYSAMGYLLNYWFGIERTVYAAMEWPELMHEVVDRINANNLTLIDLLAQAPAEIVILGDNFSSDIQPPHFFAEWSRPYYIEAIRRLHAAGKCVAVHIDGRLQGALGMFRDLDVDCADAVTPTPMGDLDPEQCRAEAGSNMILSGGVSPDLWLPSASLDAFEAAVRRWLALKRHSPRVIANAGDQVPPGADEDRIRRMRNIVEEEGHY